MLQGKKKALAAQIALGLMLAGQSQLMDYGQVYAADYEIGSVEGADELAGNTFNYGGWGGYRFDNEGKAILGETGSGAIWEVSGTSITGNNININADAVGCFAHLIDGSAKGWLKAQTVTGNVITLGATQVRKFNNYYGDAVITNIFNENTDGVTSENNTLKLGTVTTPEGTIVKVGEKNDIVLLGGRNMSYDGTPHEEDANYSSVSFEGRNLTLEDAAGTEKINKATLAGTLTAARDLTVVENVSAKNYSMTKGLVAKSITATGGGITAGGAVKAIDGGVSAQGNIAVTGGALSATGNVSSTGSISAIGINAINVAANSTINAGSGDISASGKVAGTDISAANINAGYITADTVNVGAGAVTVNNGASNVSGNITAGTVNITQNATLKANAIVNGGTKLTVNVNSTAAGKVLDLTEALADDVEIEVAGGSSGGGKNVAATALFNQEMGAGLSDDRKSIVNVAGAKTLRPQTKSLVETQVASLTQVMGSAELLASSGYVNASQAIKDAKAEGESASVMVPYAAVGYGNIKQNSGSYVNTKNFNANIGFAKEVDNKNGKLMFGPMLEYGRGNYDSHLDDGTTGEGTAQNYGVGFMARQNNHNGTYYEGSIRFGKTTSNYDSKNLWAGHNVNYDNSANYWGIHAGIGKVQRLNDKNTIDYYAKLFHTNVGGSTVAVDGSNVDFSSTKSTRSLIGARFTHKTSDVRSIYAGLAWQQEYAGDAHATIGGFETPSPSIKGASAMAELGILVAPNQSPISFDLGVKGWAGKQQGYSFNAKMNWKF